MVMETMHRRYESTTLTGTFKHAFCEQLHQKYHQGFESGVYVNDIYITMLYKGARERTHKKGLVNRLIRASNNLMDKTLVNAREVHRALGIKTLNQKANQWLTSLRDFGITRLGENENGFNDVLRFLSLVPNGGRPATIKHAETFPLCEKKPQSLCRADERYPRGHLGPYLANHRLFFGEAIQFQGNTRDDARFAAMLSIKTYGRMTSCKSLDPLLALDTEFILTQTYAPIVTEEAIDSIEAAHSKKISADDYAVSQIEELGELADLVESEKVAIGYHHNSLMLLSTSVERLEQAMNAATHAYSKTGIAVVRETLAERLCFFAQIPGNARFIARASLITSQNFADFCAFHNTQSGYRDQCMLGEPITLVQTPQKTPVFWNYHKPGSKASPSSGHTLMIGGNGAGKTALACFLDSEMNRFEGHRTFFLDRNQGAKIYIEACDGTYLTLNPAHPSACKMNPLQLPDNEENRAFCKSWMQTLLLDEGEGALGSHLCEIINETINYGFDHLAPNDRRLSTIANLLPMNFPRWPQLRRWLRANDSRQGGEYDWAFDNEEDVLNLDADKCGIDLTYLMDYVPTHISTPFYMYLLHRIKLTLTGHVTSIIIDEMWQVMKSPYWMKALEHDLPTIRKLFGHIIGLTQSPETIVNSPINDVFLNNNATLVLFANPKAQENIYIKALKVTPQEFNLIKTHAADSRTLLYKQDNESIFCDVNLRAIRDELPVLSGNVNSIREVERLRQQLGYKASDWLPTFLKRSECA
jgi:type IV secretion system protein VirB4